MEVGKTYQDLVGTEVQLRGNVFSYNKSIEPTKFQCLDVRRGSGTIMNMDTMKDKCLTAELLLKNDSMKKAQWSKPFADRECPVNTKNK